MSDTAAAPAAPTTPASTDSGYVSADTFFNGPQPLSGDDVLIPEGTDVDTSDAEVGADDISDLPDYETDEIEAEQPQALEKYKLKVNHQDVEIEGIDNLKAMAQMYLASSVKLEDVKALEQNAKQRSDKILVAEKMIKSAITGGPDGLDILRQVFKDLGGDLDTIAAQVVLDRHEYEQLPSDARRARQLEKENQTLKQWQKQQADQEANYKRQVEDKAAADFVGEVIPATLQRANLPKTQYNMQRLVAFMQAHNERGMPLTEQVMMGFANRIRQEMEVSLPEHFKNLDADHLEKILGRDKIDKLVNKRKPGFRPTPRQGDAKQGTSKYISSEDYFKRGRTFG